MRRFVELLGVSVFRGQGHHIAQHKRRLYLFIICREHFRRNHVHRPIRLCGASGVYVRLDQTPVREVRQRGYFGRAGRVNRQ